MPCGHLNAMRFAQKPLAQPAYSFIDVPKANSALDNSCIQRIDNREHFQTCMAEMLLLGKEAVRRRSALPLKDKDVVGTNSAAKPLSLEYLADRMDIDDPCFGYLVRTKKALSASGSDDNHWKEGMLQGFITVTTFTNWQKTFRWDSQHPEAYGCDPPLLKKQRLQGQRKWDSTGELAKELQQTVHYGDVWNEGIVWPRIAEISLLGGLGCGRTMVKLVLEQLEHLKANASQNYDYVVLQATDNSIPFYESLGFVRVGGIMEEDTRQQDEDEDENNDDGEEDPKSEVVCSKVKTYVTKKRGEQPVEIAKKFKVNVWDVIFLNKGLFVDAITPTSKLIVGTTLRIPDVDDTMDSASQHHKEDIEWHIAKENDTPTQLAKKFKVSCKDLIKVNVPRLPGLMSKSRLKAGTRVQVSHFHIPTKVWKAYSHWSFPDSKIEDGEPSYMMCYKLQRATTKQRPVEEAIKGEIQEYEPTPLLWAPDSEISTSSGSSTSTENVRPTSTGVKHSPPLTEEAATPSRTPVLVARDVNSDELRKVKVTAAGSVVKPSPMMTNPTKTPTMLELKPPKRAVSSFVLFCQDMRTRKKQLLEGLSVADASKLLADRWQKVPNKVRQKFEQEALQKKQEYELKKAAYLTQLAELEANRKVEQAAQTLSTPGSDLETSRALVGKVDLDEIKKKDHSALYNKIVKLKPEAIPFARTVVPKDVKAEEHEAADPTINPALQPTTYEYWFCLTFIPDLAWCHLVPLVKCGEFTPADKKPRLVGRPKWKLVREELQQEIDISSRYVIPVRSRETKHSANADNEEWDIIDELDVPAKSTRKPTNKKNRKRSKSASSFDENASKKRAKGSPPSFANGVTALLGQPSVPVNQRSSLKTNVPVSESRSGGTFGSSDPQQSLTKSHYTSNSVNPNDAPQETHGKWVEPTSHMSQPPAQLDLLSVKTNLNGRDDKSGSGAHSGGSQPSLSYSDSCTCGSHVPCAFHSHHHRQPYHPYGESHQYEVYHYPEDSHSYHDAPYYHHHHPPHTGWHHPVHPSHGPYNHPRHYLYHQERHYPAQPPVSSYYQPPYSHCPSFPASPVCSSPCKNSSSKRLGLSVEQEVAV